MKTLALSVLLALGIAAALGNRPGVAVAQAVPTTIPTTTATTYPTIGPTLGPTTAPTLKATTTPAYQTHVPMQTTVPVQTTVPMETTVPEPTVIPGTPPPIAAMFHGCNVFAPNDPVYNAPIASLPADPASAQYMASFLAALPANATLTVGGGLQDWRNNLADSSTPRYTLVNASGSVVHGVTSIPFEPGFAWEDQNVAGGHDHHLDVIDTSSCTLYEAYVSGPEPPASWTISGTNLVQNSPYGAAWPLDMPFSPKSGGVDAANLPYWPGMVRPEDYQQGCICHTLHMDVYVNSLAGGEYVYPANSPEAVGYYHGPAPDTASALPLGARLRLKASYQLPCGSACPQAQMIAQALQNYGAIVMDTGGYAGMIYVADYQPAPGAGFSYPWNTPDIEQVSKIPLSEFDVIPPPSCASIAACLK